eukprot:151363-Rhodomonas_salina.1
MRVRGSRVAGRHCCGHAKELRNGPRASGNVSGLELQFEGSSRAFGVSGSGFRASSHLKPSA